MASRSGGGIQVPSHSWVADFRADAASNFVRLYLTTANSVISLTFQPMISYQLGHDWYLRSSDATWTFNLRHATSTTIPLSAGLGKVWKFSNGMAINGSVAGEWMVYRQFAPQHRAIHLKVSDDAAVSDLSNCESRKKSNSDTGQSFAQNMEDCDEINHISLFRPGSACRVRLN